MIYLDNAASGGYKPMSVINAVAASLRECANPGRSGHRLSMACAEHVLSCRRLLSDLFSGYGFERAVFTKSCTEALNIALLGVLKEGDHVIATCLEHNSVLRPLEHLKKKGVIDYDVVPLKNGRIAPDEVAALVKENTRLVCVTSASNVTGYSPDLKAIRNAVPEHVLLLTDGAQGAGHVPISMREDGIDLLALAGHKGLYAMQIGALLFSPRVEPRPLLFGGTGSVSVSLDMPDFYPDALESGTLCYPAICSLFEGLLIVKTHLKESGERLLSITSDACKGIWELPDYILYSAPNRCGIVAFAHKSIPSEEIASSLDGMGIAVRGGLHCAPLAHQALGTLEQGLVRASFSPLQGRREVRALLAALRKITSA